MAAPASQTGPTLGGILALAAARKPRGTAIVDGERRFNFHEWLARIHRLGHALQQLGIRKEDHVVFLLKNREEHAAIYWACQMLGATATPLNWRYAQGDVEFCVRDAGAVAVVAETDSREAALAAREHLPGVAHWIFVGPDTPADWLPFESLCGSDGDPGMPAGDVHWSDTSIMLYTSGTTGQPKGVPRSHFAEHAAALAHIVQSGNRFDDRTLAVMPLYHTMGVRSTIAMGMLNGTLICQADWSPRAAAGIIQHEKVNSLYLVPTLYHDLVQMPGLNRFDLSSAKKLGYAGAPMHTALMRKVERVFNPDIMLNHFGSTEIYTFTVCDRVRDKPMCAGKPGIFGHARVVEPDPHGGSRADDLVSPGETGELIISMESAEAFSGYWNRPDADAKAIRDGWYFTGDLVYEDSEGDYFTVGRMDDMIISGGENIYPLEVEAVISKHPQVEGVCVVGLPDPRMGQAVTAFIVRRVDGAQGGDAVTEEELDRFCNASPHLAGFKRPRRYQFVDQIPKGPTGKVLRRKLLEQQIIEGRALRS